MAEVYANLIRRGRKTIEQVPEHLREEVKAILAADGNGRTSKSRSNDREGVGKPAPLIFVGRLKGGSDGPAYYASRA